jgi:hypothetical protein
MGLDLPSHGTGNKTHNTPTQKTMSILLDYLVPQGRSIVLSVALIAISWIGYKAVLFRQSVQVGSSFRLFSLAMNHQPTDRPVTSLLP